MSARRLSFLLFPLAVAGCVSSYRVVEFPQREADLYPLSQTQEGVSVAIDEVRSGARADRYFGADLPDRDILPVAVIVSNNGPHAVQLKPSDVLLHEGMQVIDPLPTESVMALVSASGTEARKYFDGLSFKPTVVSPGGSYEGIMFFPMPKKVDRNFSVLPLFDTRLQVVVGARDMESQVRYHFGPYSLEPLHDDDDP